MQLLVSVVYEILFFHDFVEEFCHSYFLCVYRKLRKNMWFCVFLGGNWDKSLRTQDMPRNLNEIVCSEIRLLETVFVFVLQI
jgi:hypothetical protein